jgi:hypothetical protein
MAQGCSWAVAAGLAVAGKRNAFRHRCGFFGMLTDVQTRPDVADRQPCEFPIPFKKNEPDKSREINHLTL